MSMKQEVISRTIAGVLAAIIVAIIWWVYGNLSSLLWTAWLGITYPVTIPAWLLALLSVMSVVLIGGIVISGAQEANQSGQHEFAKFNEMEFFGFRWRWDWTSKGFPNNLMPYCPRCDRLARYAEGGTFRSNPRVRLYCSNCENIINEKPSTYREIKNDLELEIEHAVRTGRWKQLVGENSQDA